MSPPLLLIESFYSGSEIALLSADKLGLRKLSRQGHKGAKLALELSSHPERILSATLLMTSLCVIGISALVALYFMHDDAIHADILSVLFTSPLVVLFGELIPKTIYQRYSSLVAPVVSYAIYWTYWCFYPITRILSAYTSRLSRLVGPINEMLTGKRHTTREELETMLSFGKRESEIKAGARKMIKRILDFRESEAKNALIPLVRVEAIEETATVHEALLKFEQTRHSRMPVYSDRVDNIVGLLEIADLFSATELEQPIRDHITPAHYVAETQRLDDLLLDMRREGDELAVVVDEHGGAVGILTVEDIVEEIVGEIQDEYDTDAAPFKELGEDRWLIQARMEIQEINEKLGFEVPEGDYETLSGFLLQQFGRIPQAPDELYFNTPAGLFKFTIRKATERHIESVLVQRTAEKREESDA